MTTMSCHCSRGGNAAFCDGPHDDDEAAESPRGFFASGDGSPEPFCACGRRISECDRSRAGCSRVTAQLSGTPSVVTK